ncbi:MAG: Hsp20/alpha crystallin family protein [Nitrospinales bacterium]
MNLMAYEPKDFLDRFIVNNPLFDRDAGYHVSDEKNYRDLRVNISETPESYTLVAEVPGLKEENIDIEAKDGVLTLKGHQETKEESEDKNYRVREFSERRFERSFRLGDTVDQDNIEAQLKDGLLTVTVPKREEAKPKAVKIKVTP